jgi:hypothetical protein
LQHEYSRYITLSYRWTAETEETILITDNKPDFEQCIPTNKVAQSLPRCRVDCPSTRRSLSLDRLPLHHPRPERGLGQTSRLNGQYLQKRAAQSRRCRRAGPRGITQPLEGGALPAHSADPRTGLSSNEAALLQTRRHSEGC